MVGELEHRVVGEVGIIVAGFVAALDAALNSRSLWDHRAMIRALRHDGAPAREERLLYAVAAVILVAGLIIAGGHLLQRSPPRSGDVVRAGTRPDTADRRPKRNRHDL